MSLTASSSSSSRIEVQCDVLEKLYDSVSFYFPYKLNFFSQDDGVLEFSVSGGETGEYVFKNRVHMVYFISSTPMEVSVDSFGEPFDLIIKENLYYVISSMITKIVYRNLSGAKSKFKVFYSSADDSSAYFVTWGDRIVRLGNDQYRLGD